MYLGVKSVASLSLFNGDPVTRDSSTAILIVPKEDLASTSDCFVSPSVPPCTNSVHDRRRFGSSHHRSWTGLQRASTIAQVNLRTDSCPCTALNPFSRQGAIATYSSSTSSRLCPRYRYSRYPPPFQVVLPNTLMVSNSSEQEKFRLCRFVPRVVLPVSPNIHLHPNLTGEYELRYSATPTNKSLEGKDRKR